MLLWLIFLINVSEDKRNVCDHGDWKWQTAFPLSLIWFFHNRLISSHVVSTLPWVTNFTRCSLWVQKMLKMQSFNIIFKTRNWTCLGQKVTKRYENEVIVSQKCLPWLRYSLFKMSLVYRWNIGLVINCIPSISEFFKNWKAWLNENVYMFVLSTPYSFSYFLL